MRTAVVGLSLMMAGLPAVRPGVLSALFEMFLLALFVLAAGITVVQVVANPLISLLGPPATVHQPPDIRAGLQFARHDPVSLRGIDLDPRLAGDGRSRDSQRRRLDELPRAGHPRHRGAPTSGWRRRYWCWRSWCGVSQSPARTSDRGQQLARGARAAAPRRASPSGRPASFSMSARKSRSAR